MKYKVRDILAINSGGSLYLKKIIVAIKGSDVVTIGLDEYEEIMKYKEPTRRNFILLNMYSDSKYSLDGYKVVKLGEISEDDLSCFLEIRSKIKIPIVLCMMQKEGNVSKEVVGHYYPWMGNIYIHKFRTTTNQYGDQNLEFAKWISSNLQKHSDKFTIDFDLKNAFYKV